MRDLCLVRFSHDVLLIGRGLAGAVLATTMMKRGLRIHVFDQLQNGSASRAAAGIVNPIVFRRDILSWRAEEFLPIAEAFYTGLEKDLGTKCWHPTELVKLFPTPHEAAQWERAMTARSTSIFLSRKAQVTIEEDPLLTIAHGHGTVARSAWLDVKGMLYAQREHLLAEGSLAEELIPFEGVRNIPGGVSVGSRSAPWLIHAAGPFSDMPSLFPVHGEVLTVRIPGLTIDRMIHRGVFVLPLGKGRYRVGATFRWNNIWDGPSAEGRNQLLGRLKEFIHADVEILEHEAGVRPASQDRRPLLGPVAPHRAVMNGLGSRGVLLAPWCAGHLVDHLFEGSPLDPEVDVLRSF